MPSLISLLLFSSLVHISTIIIIITRWRTWQSFICMSRSTQDCTLFELVFKFFQSISLQSLHECLEHNTGPVVELGFEPSSGYYLKQQMNDKQIPLQIYVGSGVWEYTWSDFSLFWDFYLGGKNLWSFTEWEIMFEISGDNLMCDHLSFCNLFSKASGVFIISNIWTLHWEHEVLR